MNVAPPPDPSVTATPCHRSTVRHSRLASSHRAAFGGPLFRPCGLRFAPCPRGSSRFAAFDARRARLRYSLPYWAYFGLFPPQAAAFVRPFSLREKGGFWAGLLHTVVPLTKRLPFPKGELAALAD